MTDTSARRYCETRLSNIVEGPLCFLAWDDKLILTIEGYLRKQRRFLAIMEEKRAAYQSGFKLTRKRLDNIQDRLTDIMKRIADKVSATFTLKYINGNEA